MSRASVDALPLIHPTFSAFSLGLRDLSRVSALPLKVCHKKQEKFHPTLETIDGKEP
jgi:hypothetical protein